jgi:hypothetical protein
MGLLYLYRFLEEHGATLLSRAFERREKLSYIRKLLKGI